MKRYVVLIAYERSEWDEADEETRDYYYRAHAAFSAYVAEHGTEHASAALAEPEHATTVRRAGRARDGDVVVTEGPFAETAEQVGGYYDVELPDLDHALTAASLLPAAYTVEIRPTITIT
ncbi:MAG TPA: YciI family protein [Nocardioides sp.]|nr:YciI family protein [Nocardioides sp.]